MVFSPGRVCTLFEITNADAGFLLGFCTMQWLHVLDFCIHVNQNVTLKIEGVISSKPCGHSTTTCCRSLIENQ